jgi:hypothetical protein
MVKQGTAAVGRSMRHLIEPRTLDEQSIEDEELKDQQSRGVFLD